MTIGIECEHCGLYQDECSMIATFHSITKEPLIRLPVKRLYLRLDRDIVSEIAALMYSCSTAASRVCYDRLQQYVDNNALGDIPVSSLRGRGVSIKGEQVLTVVVERALRSFFGLSQYSVATRHLFFCGIDNLCGSGILMPYILKVLGVPNERLPVCVINHFCLLDGKKFSTSSKHAVWASEFLQVYPSDLIRLYLSYLHNPTGESNFRVEDFVSFSNRFLDSLVDLFSRGCELLFCCGNDRIEAGAWLVEDVIFYRELNDSMEFCIDSFAHHNPLLAVRRIFYLLKVLSSYTAQSYTSRAHRNTLRTKVALMLHGYQCLAYCLSPSMPTLAAHIFDCLGVGRDKWHAERRLVRVIEPPSINIEFLVGSLFKMKQKVS